MPQAPFMLAMGLMVIILLMAMFHPVVRRIQANVEEDEDAELHPH